MKGIFSNLLIFVIVSICVKISDERYMNIDTTATIHCPASGAPCWRKMPIAQQRRVRRIPVSRRRRRITKSSQNSKPGSFQHKGGMSYKFRYVAQPDYHTKFGHHEKGVGYKKRGAYFVDQPDGLRRTVSYIANGSGFHPFITVQPKHAPIDKRPFKHRMQARELAKHSPKNPLFRGDTDVIFSSWEKVYDEPLFP